MYQESCWIAEHAGDDALGKWLVRQTPWKHEVLEGQVYRGREEVNDCWKQKNGESDSKCVGRWFAEALIDLIDNAAEGHAEPPPTP